MKKLILLIKKYREDIYALLSLFLVRFLVYFWTDAEPENELIYWLAVVFSLCALVSLLYSIKLLWRKYNKKISKIIKSAYVKLGRRFVMLLEKIGIMRSRGNILSGKTTFLFDFMNLKSGRRPTKKRLKWRQLEDDRERLGYLYGRMIEGKIITGANIRSSNTPDEIAEKHTENETEGELFSCYSEHRYYEVSPIDGENLAKIKQILGIK